MEDIHAREQVVGSFITISDEMAIAQAKEIDDKGIDADNVMSGIPLAVKDNISTKGILTTAASKMLYNYEPIFDATAVEKLYAKDMIVIGKANMDEFAMGALQKHHILKRQITLGTIVKFREDHQVVLQQQ